jgi:hypothetical protein
LPAAWYHPLALVATDVSIGFVGWSPDVINRDRG